MTIEEYLIINNRKFYKLIDIKNEFPNWKNELNALVKTNKIVKREGINKIIIIEVL